ncbi:MAG TPA: cytochrome b/b6 domain-containing protein [Gammaproteobacteria bacterium]|nr:cytochrome b/b6 domain-containing protein [Gammaproteobacteria bacterium]
MESNAAADTSADRKSGAGRTGTWIYRHTVPIRITHWVNALAVLVMLMSGLQIFNAHPALYWGNKSLFDRPLLALTAERGADGTLQGVTTLLGYRFDTTGVLGASEVDGQMQARGFPTWATLPSQQWLAMGRRWHFFFAWILVLNALAYASYSLASRHLRRDLLPTGTELRGTGRSVLDHLRLRFPTGEEAKRYNVLQKLSYLGVMFGLLPLAVLTGLTMSPWMAARFPWLLNLFDGRQSARTLHFVVASLLVIFALVHLVMVLLTGPWNNLRGIILGRYRIPESRHEPPNSD